MLIATLYRDYRERGGRHSEFKSDMKFCAGIVIERKKRQFVVYATEAADVCTHIKGFGE